AVGDAVPRPRPYQYRDDSLEQAWIAVLSAVQPGRSELQEKLPGRPQELQRPDRLLQPAERQCDLCETGHRAQLARRCRDNPAGTADKACLSNEVLEAPYRLRSS